ncbi:MAG: hypothetical protein L3J91_00100, partial [Thermoplasmata archaeon]|nr:hypothetical protein [Thermoplasmata archaeon]
MSLDLPWGVYLALGTLLAAALVVVAPAAAGGPGPVFTFPYAYAPPTVPQTEGVQGSVGATAPGIGPTGSLASMLPVAPVGPGTFTPGSSHAIGTTPCGGSGCTTTIAAAAYWGNETYSLLGNVSIAPGVTLTVDDSALTFTEPSTATSWAYGFAGLGSLVVRTGSNVSSTPANGRAWFLATGSATVVSSTLAEPSAQPGLVSGRGLNLTSITAGLYFGYGGASAGVSLNVSGAVTSSVLSNGTASATALTNSLVTGTVLTAR